MMMSDIVGGLSGCLPVFVLVALFGLGIAEEEVICELCGGGMSKTLVESSGQGIKRASKTSSRRFQSWGQLD